MSEQSPWGSPPPDHPYGRPTHLPPQPPHPQQQPQQPYQQPGGSGSGYGGPPYGGSPYGQGPQPPKRRTGLIVGIVSAVLLVAAAFTVTLLVASGDDDPDEASSSDTAATSPDETGSDETGSEKPTESTSDGQPPPEGAIVGDGYSFELPGEAWTDQSAEASQLGESTIDTVIVLGASIQLAQSNIIVEALSDGGATSLEDLEGLWKRNLSGADGATTVPIDETTIDGERAIGVRIDDRANAAGAPIIQIAYLTLHDAMQYSVVVSFPAQDSVSEADFETMLGSWRWA